MLKKEIIWREILNQSINKRTEKFTQKELSQKFSFSLSTVSHALKDIRNLKIIDVKSRYFQIRDIKKFLYFWATHRQFKKDIIFQTHSPLYIKEIENSFPPKIIYGAYTAYNHYFQDQPADYDKIYVYIEEKNLGEIKKRFPFKKGYTNVNILKSDKLLKQYGPIIPLPHLFVDLWNLEEWFAQEFLNALKNKILS